MYQYTKPSQMQSVSFSVFHRGQLLDPLLFVLYTYSLASTARHHPIYIDMYADDTQLYNTMDISNEKL